MDINLNILEFNQSTDKNLKLEEYSIIIDDQELNLNKLIKSKKKIQLKNIKREILLRLLDKGNLIAFGSIEKQKIFEASKSKQKITSFWIELHPINKVKNIQKKLILKICISFPKNNKCCYSFIDTNSNKSDLFTFSKMNLSQESINSDIKKNLNNKSEITEQSNIQRKILDENYNFNNFKLKTYKRNNSRKMLSINESKKLFSDNKGNNKIRMEKQNRFNKQRTFDSSFGLNLSTSNVYNEKSVIKNNIKKNSSINSIQKPLKSKIPISYHTSVKYLDNKKNVEKQLLIKIKNYEIEKNIKSKRDILKKTNKINKTKVIPINKNIKNSNKKNGLIKNNMLNNTYITEYSKKESSNALLSLTQSEKEILLSENDCLLTSPMSNNFNKYKMISSKTNNNTFDTENTSKKIKLELINDIDKDLLNNNYKMKTNKNKNIDLNQYISTVVKNKKTDFSELNNKERKTIRKKNLIKIVNDFNRKENTYIKSNYNNSLTLRDISLHNIDLNGKKCKNIRLNSLNFDDYYNNDDIKITCLTEKNRNSNFDVKELIKTEKEEDENNILNILLLNDDKKQRNKLMELDNKFLDIKNDFELLYNKKFISSINNDLINFELNLCVEKTMTLFSYYNKSVSLFHENKCVLIKFIKNLKLKIKDTLKKRHKLKYKEELTFFEINNDNKNRKYILNIKNDKLIQGKIFGDLFEKEYNSKKNFKILFKKIIQKQIDNANKKKDIYRLVKLKNLIKQKNKNNYFSEFIISSSNQSKEINHNLPKNINKKKIIKKNKTERAFNSKHVITKKK